MDAKFEVKNIRILHADRRCTHYNNQDYAEGVWDELGMFFRAQDHDFVEQDEPRFLLNTLATPAAKRPSTHTKPTASFQRQSVVPTTHFPPSPTHAVACPRY